MRESRSPTYVRLLTLRQFAAFGDVDLGELATIADNLTERTFETGDVVVATGAALAGAHLILDGRLEASDRSWGPRELLGELEVIAVRASTRRIVAAVPTRTFLLHGDTFTDLLEDNYDVLSMLRQRIARDLLALGASAFVPTSTPLVEGRALGMVDRIVAMRAYLPPVKGNIQALAALAQASDEVHLAPGSQLYAAGEQPVGLFAILEGRVRLFRPDGPEKIAVASTIGGLECLADTTYVETAIATTPVRALRIPVTAFIDVMEDHTDFAIALLRRLAGSLLDLQAARQGN